MLIHHTRLPEILEVPYSKVSERRSQDEVQTNTVCHGTDSCVLFFLVASLCQDQVIGASAAFGRISHSGKNCINKKILIPPGSKTATLQLLEK